MAEFDLMLRASNLRHASDKDKVWVLDRMHRRPFIATFTIEDIFDEDDNIVARDVRHVYLTTEESRLAEYQMFRKLQGDMDEHPAFGITKAIVRYGDYVQHVREATSGLAKMPVEDMIHMLKTGLYVIG